MASELLQPHGRRRPASPGAGRLDTGSNQSGVRAYNERLVLSLIRAHGRLAKAELARLTGLSAQTVSVIVRQLDMEGLVLAAAPQKGKIGQPSVPFSLNPDGASALGLKIGRRSAELALLDFIGRTRAHREVHYAYPRPDDVLAFAKEAMDAVFAQAGKTMAEHCTGIGVALPNEIWQWEDEIAAPRGALNAWQTFDLEARLAEWSGLPVQSCNDASAACAAELLFGNPHGHHDFLYVFVGFFVGAGVVLDGTLYAGRSGNAGAIGSMPVGGRSGTRRQLLHEASLSGLENRLVSAGLPAAHLLEAADEDWQALEADVAAWLDSAARGLAQAIVAANAIIDFQAVLIDGAFPAQIRARLVAKVQDETALLDQRGITPFRIEAGTLGRRARAVGGATLPLLQHFARDRDVLFKMAV